jgi:D-alanine-D-alanine ligase-like ATP-grasp enzyme
MTTGILGDICVRRRTVIESISIQGYTSFPGIRWRLKDPTTELTLALSGSPSAGTLSRYAAWFERRFAGCFRFFEGTFPSGLLANSHAEPVAVHLAAGITALQRLGCQPVRRAQVLEASPSLLRLALPSFNGAVLELAIRLAIQLMLELDADPSGQGERFRLLNEEIDTFVVNAQGISRCGEEQLRFALAAVALGLPLVATITGFLEIGHGCGRRVLSHSLLNTASPPGALASDKLATYLVLNRAGIPVPQTRICNQEFDLAAAAAELGWPLVVKPLDQSLQRGVTTDVADAISLEAAFRVARNVSADSVLLQKQVVGQEFRITGIGLHFTVARRLNPANVVGDGQSTVEELVNRANANPLRGTHPGALCGAIQLDDSAIKTLEHQVLGLRSIPAAGQVVRLSSGIGRSCGGITSSVVLHPSYEDLVRRAARVMQLDVIGLDLITPDPLQPWWDVDAVILECNPRPGLKGHEHADPALRIYEAALQHGLQGQPQPWILAVSGAGLIIEAWPALEQAFTALLPPGTQLGVLMNGSCWLGGAPLPLAPSDKGQVGQALLADSQCGGALLAWRAEELQAYGRPCEQLDLAVLAEGADPIVVAEILDADPQVVVWLGPGREAWQDSLDSWQCRGEGRRCLDLANAAELELLLPELLAIPRGPRG